MVYSYTLTTDPGAALVRLVTTWIEEADDDSDHAACLRRPGLLYVIESVSGSLIESGAEQGNETIKRDGRRIGDLGAEARERWNKAEGR